MIKQFSVKALKSDEFFRAFLLFTIKTAERLNRLFIKMGKQKLWSDDRIDW